jgi:hypothetical protein
VTHRVGDGEDEDGRQEPDDDERRETMPDATPDPARNSRMPQQFQLSPSPREEARIIAGALGHHNRDLASFVRAQRVA